MKAAWGVVAAIGLAAPGCGSEVDGGGGESCDAYLDEAPAAAPVTLRFRNERAEAIYLGSQIGCGVLVPFTLRDASGAVLPWHLDGCGFTCETSQDFSGGCAADCAIPPVFLIAPGGHHDLTWTGVVVETVDMPQACYAEGGASETCERRVNPAAGSYEVTGEAFTEVTGCDPSQGACTCEPSAEGSCQLDYTATISGAPITTVATLAYPDQGMIEIVFQ